MYILGTDRNKSSNAKGRTEFGGIVDYICFSTPNRAASVDEIGIG